MLLNMTIENWRCFRDEVTFSMVASREQRHGEMVAKSKKYKMGILPVAVIFGGNASGKTSLLAAMDFAREFVTSLDRGYMYIRAEPFVLRKNCEHAPSCFKFQFLLDDQAYEYSFSVTREKVLQEKLLRLGVASEKLLYSREGKEIEFGQKFTGKQRQFLYFVNRGTKDNALFLTTLVSYDADDDYSVVVDKFRMVYDWFGSLRVVGANKGFMHHEQFVDVKNPIHIWMNGVLPSLDTGVAEIGGVDVPINGLGLEAKYLSELNMNLSEGDFVPVAVPWAYGGDNRYVVTKRDGKLVAQRLATMHMSESGEGIAFTRYMESDGTNRLLDILPAFMDLTTVNGAKVYAIDEIERSLHTILAVELIQSYLDKCNADTRTQLFLTTHNPTLMDQKLFRRDEMWLAEREPSGASKLVSFSEYEGVRHDKDVRRSYLDGRLGGVPDIVRGGLFDAAFD